MENQYRQLATKPADEVLGKEARKVALHEGKGGDFSNFIARNESAFRDLAQEGSGHQLFENISRRTKDQLLPATRQVSVVLKVDMRALQGWQKTQFFEKKPILAGYF